MVHDSNSFNDCFVLGKDGQSWKDAEDYFDESKNSSAERMKNKEDTSHAIWAVEEKKSNDDFSSFLNKIWSKNKFFEPKFDFFLLKISF